MFTDHYVLKYLENKPIFGGKICRWLLLFHEYDFEFVVKMGILNVRFNHLWRLDTGEEPTSIEGNLPKVQLFSIKVVNDHFVDIIQFLAIGMAPVEYTTQQKELVIKETSFTLITWHLHKNGTE